MYIRKNAHSQKFCEEQKRVREMHVRILLSSPICTQKLYWIMSTSTRWVLTCVYYRIIKVWTCAPKQVDFPLFLSASSLFLAFFGKESVQWNWCPNEYADFVFISLAESQIALFSMNHFIFCNSPFRRNILPSIEDTHINGFVSKRDKQPICSAWLLGGTSLGPFHLCGWMKNNKMPWWWLSQSIELSKHIAESSISISRQTEVEQEIGGTARFKFIMSCQALPWKRDSYHAKQCRHDLYLALIALLISSLKSQHHFGLVNVYWMMLPSTNQINWRTSKIITCALNIKSVELLFFYVF